MTEARPPQSYTGRDYESALSSLIARVRETRPEILSDLTDANLGRMLIELAAATIDMVSFGQDAAAAEVFLSTCKRYESALTFAKSVGYAPRPFTAATATVISVGDLPSQVSTYGGIVRKGQRIVGSNNLAYEVTADTPVAAGANTMRVNVLEGVSYEETFAPLNTRNRVVTVAQPKVADSSWAVFVGDASDPNNEWEQVDSVLLETSPTSTYDVAFDAAGRLQVRFGDNAAGAIPSQDVTVRYRTCNGATGNSPARSIRGTLKVELNSPGTGLVGVECENYEAQPQTVGGTQFQSGEAAGLTNGGPTVTFVLAHVPIVPGQVLITISTTGGTVTLRDDNNGQFSVISNTTGRSLLSSAIIYSSGSCALTFDGSIATNGTVSADYSFFAQADSTQVVIVGAATGGDDRESLEEMRVNVATFIRTQDRLITAEDYRKGLTRVAGVELSFADVWASSYNGNVVRLYVWAKEASTLTALSSNGVTVTVPYTRYARAADATVLAVQDFIKPRTLLTVHHVIYRPDIAWIDLYLGTISYDRRMPQATVREDIANAIATVFQNFDGFSVLLAEIYNAVRDVRGVLQFNIERITVGYRDQSSVPELQGSTSGTPSVSGTMTVLPLSPGSVVVTIRQSADLAIVLTDDGSGAFTVSEGAATLVSSSINYITGAWTATFSAPLVSGQEVSVVYRDVQFDYRRVQNSAYNDALAPDLWPPPTADFGSPFRDGTPVLWSGPGYPNETRQYAALKDINLTPITGSAHFYDETYLYNDEIFYDSFAVEADNVRAINARRVEFDLNPR